MDKQKQTALPNRKGNVMFDNNENLVTDVTENVETTTTEEIVGEQEENKPAEKTYTQAELDEIVGKRLARNTAKVRKEYDRKYGNLTQVLRAGTGKESVEEMTDTFAEFYRKKGIQISQEPNYTAKDIEVLARAEADEIIRSGYEEVVEEVYRQGRHCASLAPHRATVRPRRAHRSFRW